MEIREGAVSFANISMISSAVELLESSEIFRPYESEPAPEDDKYEEIEIPELTLPHLQTQGPQAENHGLFNPSKQRMVTT